MPDCKFEVSAVSVGRHIENVLHKGSFIRCYCKYDGKIRAIFDDKPCPLKKEGGGYGKKRKVRLER